MRVVYITDIGIEGGATKSLIELVSTMKNECGIEPIVLTSSQNSLNKSLSALGIENHPVGHGAFLQGAPSVWWKKPAKWLLYAVCYYTHFFPSLKKAMRVVDWNMVDLIHTNVARDDLGMEISKRTGIPNICHIREFAELDFDCWSYRPHYAKYLANHTNGFIAISNAVKQYWVGKGIPTDTIDIVYNGVDYQRIATADHKDWETADMIRMVIVGGVIPNKGQYQAIEAMCLLPEGIRKHYTLDIIGGVTDTYRKKLQEPLNKHGIADQVRFLGKCDDVYDRLKEYHVGLMCSKAEGFGRVTVEYMHAGLLVIASDCGANPELIQDGYSGLLYDRMDARSLSEKMAYLWDHRSEMITCAENGKMEAQKYTKQKNAIAVYEVYRKLMR